ncbi:class I SAM-dependent methyltransferase [Actinomadura sp. WMMB 499]|uniref:class I SAM-dependent methyltransferase n=1 Tax=Actinomadura sp. WMMB 499 TaxID=1219491 RepID=UPI0012464410|nr:class I SAM-dependent methyltransferase [Actinomadura sp. WMMB 499]QFG23727.1 class I SAM-dependent methyltransferase [Actinomadura sp. WMMB 499]
MSSNHHSTSARRATYDGFAETFAAEASVSAYNAHYDRPTVLELLGEVAGKRVLDAGCGPGLYLAELNRRGAETIGFDQSSDMINAARQRLGPGANLRRHDLDEPLHWLDDHAVDLVLAALVIHYLDDRVGALRELHRVLRPNGRLVLSTSHPTADWLDSGGGYFEQRYEQQQWSRGFKHWYWRQPLERWIEEFTAAGFAIENLVEHQPQRTMSQHHPSDYAKLTREPGFIAYRLAKATATC